MERTGVAISLAEVSPKQLRAPPAKVGTSGCNQAHTGYLLKSLLLSKLNVQAVSTSSKYLKKICG